MKGKLLSCCAFKLYVEGGQDAHPTRGKIYFTMQFKCGLAYASKLNAETGSPARPTRVVEKLTVKLDAQQLRLKIMIFLRKDLQWIHPRSNNACS